MRGTLLCIFSITCSACVLADLEFYPDYQRPEISEEEWVKDQPFPDFRHFLDEPRPVLPKQKLPMFLDRLKSQSLAARLSEMTRKLEEARRPQYFFKILPQDGFEYVPQEGFVPKSRPDFHILDDVRMRPDAEPDDDFPQESFPKGGFPEDNPDSFAKQAEERQGEGRGGAEGPDLENQEVERDAKSGTDRFHAKLVDDPTEFAYPPSDPRFFEDASQYDPPKQFEEERPQPFFDSIIPIQNRKDDSQVQSNLMDSNKDHFVEDGVEVVARPHTEDDTTGVYIIAIVAGISAAATVGLIAFGIGWYNLQKHVKNASDVDYPAYGVTGPNKDISPSGDRRLAQSAQMYHYQHQKQQIIAMESRAAATERHGSMSEADSDEENEEGDYTVYECPGLAPTGEMEVKNPLFQDDPTPAQTPKPEEPKK